MKNVLLTIICTMTIICGYSQKKYTIKGVINGDCTEKCLYIQKYMTNGDGADSALINEQHFIFSGNIETPELYMIFFDPDKRETRRLGMSPVFVEPGEVEVVINPADMFGGNEILTGSVNKEFKNTQKHIRLNYMNPIDSLTQLCARATPEDRANYLEERDAYQKELTTYNLDYISKNHSSPVSLFLLSTFFYTIPDAELESVLNSFPDNFKKCTIYKNMAQFREMRQKNNDKNSTFIP